VKHLDEYRDADAVRRWAEAIARVARRPWTLMEVCGGQTHAIVRFGLDRLLPDHVQLIHGPGCPVCVTPIEAIDTAIAIGRRPEAIVCSFGDMMRVPGSAGNLLTARARGADVRVVLSPMDAVRIAEENPTRIVCFFAVGFETTAPTAAAAAAVAMRRGVGNFRMLVCHVRVPPAIEAILSDPANTVQGFLAAGHVCTIMGTDEYEPIARRFRVPIVVTGFEPADILQGVHACVRQLEEGRCEVENRYARTVRREGNTAARSMMDEVLRPVTSRWRGLGEIPLGGFEFTPRYAAMDARTSFPLSAAAAEAESECIAGSVLRGLKKPGECPAFGTRCTPETPLGAPMVSSEGACAAYFRYRRGGEK